MNRTRPEFAAVRSVATAAVATGCRRADRRAGCGGVQHGPDGSRRQRAGGRRQRRTLPRRPVHPFRAELHHTGGPVQPPSQTSYR